MACDAAQMSHPADAARNGGCRERSLSARARGGARFIRVDLSGVVMRAVDVSGMDTDHRRS
jgi:hypothetical protein